MSETTGSAVTGDGAPLGRRPARGRLPKLSASFLGVFLLVLAVLLASAIVGDQGLGKAVTALLLLATVIVSFRAAHVGTRVRRVAYGVAGVGAVVAVVLQIAGHRGTSVVGASVTALLIVVAQAAIVVYLARLPVISRETVMGALCVYLLVGIFFAQAFGIVDLLTAGPFFGQIDTATSFDRLYFSYITIATVGYGDLTAAPDTGRALAVAEALIGQFYLVTVVALVVGNLGREKTIPGDGQS